MSTSTGTQPTLSQTSAVVVRAVAESDLDVMDNWRRDRKHHTEFGDFMIMHREHSGREQDWLDNGLLDEARGVMMVTADDVPIGEVQWRTVSYGPNVGSQVLSIGISLQPSARGHGFGATAQALLAQYLFAQTAVNRIEATTDVENIAEQRALEKAGFTREGVLRGSQFRLGQWRDLVCYSVLRSELPGG